MPQYDFTCDECDVHFTVTRRMVEASDPYACPKCQGPTRRVFYAPPVHYHSDGFYATDYSKGIQTGTKNDALNKQWSEYFGDDPPEPAKDIPRNSSEPI